MAAKTTELVIFDCDGVLVDSEPISIAVLVEALAAAGVTMSEEEAHVRFLGRSLKSMSEILHDDYGLAIDAAFLDAMRKVLYERFRAELRAVEGVAETVDALGIAHCVASSSQPERIRLSLTVTGLLSRFEPNIFSASMVARGKPAPDLFLHASAAMGVAPDYCVVVEDSPAGIAAGKAAGMRVVAFTGGSHAKTPGHRETLLRLEPDALFDDMRELLQFVRDEKADGKEH
ncbi:HAD family hydrolase [Shinella fusca]|jgi:HAD superfamily hydrolase (TIGR01509 family)|uniref:HAD superfamily hydrolase (TIGR01509 family) n=1 Tax=Shinella fusca TaxID=544480 RepID=A0A7W7YUK4_9HYPH|nr:HAD family hydrolase [Shinella fusca]MBB5042669.1 HAD superfamily hydrolase (TIGR01509 family) [Shinella fusca]